MGLTAAIIGLALLVLIHGAGHFFAARADGAPARDLDELREADRRARESVETVWAS